MVVPEVPSGQSALKSIRLVLGLAQMFVLNLVIIGQKLRPVPWEQEIDLYLHMNLSYWCQNFPEVVKRKTCSFQPWGPIPHQAFVGGVLKVVVDFIKFSRSANVVALFTKLAERKADETLFYYEETRWTFRELDEYSNKIARIFHQRGYKKGDVVALMCPNRPELVGIWLGLGKIGVITALINTSLRSTSLAHCVNIVNSKAFVLASDFIADVDEIRDRLSNELRYVLFEESASFCATTLRLNEALEKTTGDPVGAKQTIRTTDPLLYIYTSGTTGLPKAAVITHLRVLFIGIGLKNIIGISPRDIVYNPLPMYHTAGGLLCLSVCLIYGSAMAIRTKFSASKYFPDCIKYKCTVGQYIGEMCRYMLAVPAGPDDTNHRLRLIIGNGVKANVWKMFVDRFKIPFLIEFYGSTEGNSNIVNTDNTIGAVGFKPSFVPKRLFPIVLIKYDEETGQPVRDKGGLCISCATDEPGMCVGMIKKDPLRRFEGYVDKKETSKKVIHDVLRKGDSAFLSGDILYMDELGYFYFKDRTGETFRWKGENVSTVEVESVIQRLIDFKDCTVYGVEVGNYEGRAGMAAIVDAKNEVDLDALAKGLDTNLPIFARPLFLRILPEITLTGTFKIVKTHLQREAFDVNVVKDKLYFRDRVKGFIPINRPLYEDVINGVVKI